MGLSYLVLYIYGQNILPESGMTDFRDLGSSVGQSGAANVISCDVVRLTLWEKLKKYVRTSVENC